MNSVHRRLGVRDSTTFSCPFCKGGTVTAGIDDDDCAVVLHTEPFCMTYREQDSLSFLRQARNAIQLRTENLQKQTAKPAS